MEGNNLYSLSRLIENEANNGQLLTVVNIDLAKVLQEYRESMESAFMMGRQAALAEVSLDKSLSNDNATMQTHSDNSSYYIGVYDCKAYGVYQDVAKLEAALRFWDKNTLAYHEFNTYDEALCFGRQGVAALKGISEGQVPPMQNPINWCQFVG